MDGMTPAAARPEGTSEATVKGAGPMWKAEPVTQDGRVGSVPSSPALNVSCNLAGCRGDCGICARPEGTETTRCAAHRTVTLEDDFEATATCGLPRGHGGTHSDDEIGVEWWGEFRPARASVPDGGPAETPPSEAARREPIVIVLSVQAANDLRAALDIRELTRHESIGLLRSHEALRSENAGLRETIRGQRVVLDAAEKWLDDSRRENAGLRERLAEAQREFKGLDESHTQLFEERGRIRIALFTLKGAMTGEVWTPECEAAWTAAMQPLAARASVVPLASPPPETTP